MPFRIDSIRANENHYFSIFLIFLNCSKIFLSYFSNACNIYLTINFIKDNRLKHVQPIRLYQLFFSCSSLWY